MDNGYSLSDVAMATGNGFNMGGDGMWIFALLILLFGGNGAFGNGNSASQADLQRAIDLNSIQQGQRDIESRVQEVGAETIGAVKDVAYNNLGEIRDIQQVVNNGFSNMQTEFCSTQRAIDGVNYNIQNSTQQILQKLDADRISELESKIQSLEMQNAMAGVVRYPNATTFCSGNNPFATNCGCNNI